MAHPFLIRAKVMHRVAVESVDHVPRQIASAHVGEGGIDPVALRAAEQTAQERQARLARPGAEGGELVGADVGGEAALAGVARAGVVDGDERRADEPRPQHRLVLGAEPVQFCGQEPNDLPLGDRQAKSGQKLHDPFAGHPALIREHQHPTMPMRPATADGSRIERRGRHLAVRRPPALAPIKRRLGVQHQVLNEDLLVALRREPDRASTVSLTVRSTESLETPGPRRRFDLAPFSLSAPPSGRFVALSIPEGLSGGRGGKGFSRAIAVECDQRIPEVGGFPGESRDPCLVASVERVRQGAVLQPRRLGAETGALPIELEAMS